MKKDQEKKMDHKSEIAVLGGGCFWCTEAVFKRLKGVIAVTSGYAGGTLENPTYEDLHQEDTGHAEVIQVEFDPTVINYKKLLEIFFDFHDPTTLNRQGNDEGTEYRSIILTTSDEQHKIAQEYIEELKKTKFARPIVTQLEPLQKFYPAESYHQNFYEKNEYTPYCSITISPKIKHLEEKYKDLLKR